MTWTDEKNERRCNLIDKKIAGTITDWEIAELVDLQDQMLRHRRNVAPLPFWKLNNIFRDQIGTKGWTSEYQQEPPEWT